MCSSSSGRSPTTPGYSRRKLRRQRSKRLEAVAKTGPVPCLPCVSHGAASITQQTHLLLTMSSLFERATHKVKKRIGQAVDRLRPSSSQEHSRSTSPASSQLAEPAADGVSSLQPKSASPDIPAYARPPSPPTILATTGSAVKGLLAAAHDGSDLFPPLQIALGGVLELWDVFDV